MTAGDLIASSLRLIGVLASGEVPSGAEANDSLVILNQMVEQWGIEHLMLFTLTRQTFPLVPSQQNYTVGTGGNFNMARPVNIDYISIQVLNNPAQPLELPLEILNDDQWQKVPVKSVLGALALKVYDDGGFPLRTLSFWPIPTIANNVVLGTWTALSQFPDLVTDTPFPAGYAKALRYNLAVDLAPEFGRPLPPEVAAQAVATKAAIKSKNIAEPKLESQVDSAIISSGRGKVFNWLIGE